MSLFFFLGIDASIDEIAKLLGRGFSAEEVVNWPVRNVLLNKVACMSCFMLNREAARFIVDQPKRQKESRALAFKEKSALLLQQKRRFRFVVHTYSGLLSEETFAAEFRQLTSAEFDALWPFVEENIVYEVSDTQQTMTAMMNCT